MNRRNQNTSAMLALLVGGTGPGAGCPKSDDVRYWPVDIVPRRDPPPAPFPELAQDYKDRRPHAKDLAEGRARRAEMRRTRSARKRRRGWA